jgi:DNA-binding MarR family transcriptional regulator
VTTRAAAKIAPPAPSDHSRKPDGDGSALDVSVWVRLLECHNRMLAELRRKLSEDCTMPRFDLLANLYREDGQTLATLSRRLLVTAGNLTGLVDRAERDGVVERHDDPSDRRVSRIHLTHKGRQLIEQMLPIHAEYVGEILGALDGTERRELRRVLGKLRDALAGKPMQREEEG